MTNSLKLEILTIYKIGSIKCGKRMVNETSLRKTRKLTAYESVSLAENEIVINPNDGLDIGLTHTKYLLQIVLNLKIENAILTDMDHMAGSIHLANNCRSGTVEFSQKLWKKMGKPKHVILVFKDKSIFIVNR